MNTSSQSKPAPSTSEPFLLRGSLITLRRRCGKPSCHCARGEPHGSPALSFSRKGKTHILTLAPQLLPEVRLALQQYHRQHQSLERQAEAGLRQLARRLHQARKTPRGSGR